MALGPGPKAAGGEGGGVGWAGGEGALGPGPGAMNH